MNNLNETNTQINNGKVNANNTLSVLESMIARSCTCKLREICLDKSSQDCLKHTNIYAQEMRARKINRN